MSATHARGLATLVTIAAIAALVPTLGCDKLPGFGKKDGGDEGGTASSDGKGGGVLSFLDGSFEGEITMNVSSKTSKSGPLTMVFGIKTPKVRADLTGGNVQDNPMLTQGAAFIIDPPAKKAYILLPSAKRAMLIDFDKAKAARLPHGAPGTPGTPGTPTAPADIPKIEKTGKKETIAGYTCEDWKVISKTSHADMCVAEGIKWIDLTDLGMSSPEMAFAAAASDANHFPLRVIGYDANNVETTRMEAQKIEKKKLDDARFTVPADFQVMDMSAMLGGLGGLGAPGAGGLGAPGGAGKLPPGFPPPTRAH